MPESEARVLDAMNKAEVRPEDLSYQARRESSQIQTRLTSLFGSQLDET
jgi:hypothetical protein